jgi:hypothetical protein
MNDEEIYCTPEESFNRVEFCKGCENLEIIEHGITKCKETNCNINLMSTFKFKSCPKGNW